MVARTSRLITFLNENEVNYEIIPHPPDFSAQRTAADTHTPGRAFAKTVLLNSREGPLLAVLPAPEKVDLARLSEAMGTNVTLASESRIGELFPDCEIGAEPPFGNLYDIPVYIDPRLRDDAYITFNAGSHREAIRMRYEDYEKLVQPRVLELAR